MRSRALIQAPLAARAAVGPLATLAALAAVALVAGCGGAESTRGGSTPTPSTSAQGSADTSAPSPTQGRAGGGAGPVAVYYLHDSDRGPRLYREFHRRPASASPVRDAVEAMLHDAPHDPDYVSLWPRDTRVRSVRVSGDTATVDLSGEAKRASAGSEFEAMSLQQLVHTVTAAAPTVKRVRLLVDGAPVESLWGHAAVGTRPLTRAPQVDVLAPVWLESPGHGARTGRSVRLAGQATVFEATVSWEIVRDKSVVRRGFTNATVGGPGRGTFATSVMLPAGDYVARAFESSAEDGRSLFVDDKAFTVR